MLVVNSADSCTADVVDCRPISCHQ